MKWFTLMCVAMALMAAVQRPCAAAEYFVSTQGDDARDGQSLATAFGTIQKGVDALSPGDTLTIAPGEYRQTAYRKGLGDEEHDTLIRAAVRGTVLLRGDVPAPVFTKAAGYQFVYVADFDGDVQAVNEVDTLKILELTPSAADVEFSPGSSYYDAGAKKLYISPSDLREPDKHHYTVSVTAKNGLHLDAAVRVTVDGLAATGFNSNALVPSHPGFKAVWGIIINGSRQSVIRHCTAYLNGGGLAFNSNGVRGADPEKTGYNVIEYSQGYGNYTMFSSEGGNILIYHGNHDTIRHAYAFGSKRQGLRIYGGIRGPAIIRHGLAWGNEEADIWIKGGEASTMGLAENIVALGPLNVHNLHNSITGTRNTYKDAAHPSEIRFQSESKLDRNREFADPANLDFRLQSGSRFRNAGPDNTDRGAFAYQPNIFYLSPKGDNQADGLSISSAWKTLDHALAKLEAGSTLYLEPGSYAVSKEVRVQGSAEQPASIRGRGREPVIITGQLSVSRSSHLSFERLIFAQAPQVTDSQAIGLNNCRFIASTTGLLVRDVQGLRVTHCEFTGFEAGALQIDASSNIFLSGNLFDNRHGPAVQLSDQAAILHADYNSYHDAKQAWRVGQSAVSLSDLQTQQHERHAHTLTPRYTTQSNLPRLENEYAFAGKGPLGSAIGVYHEYRQRDLPLHGPAVHSMTATTANLEWWTSVPAQFEIAWGDTPACENRETIQSSAWASYSLTGLQPGKPYYFKIISATPREHADKLVLRNITPDAPPLSFTTPTDTPPTAEYFVATDGDDQNAGRSRSQPWRTLTHAANQVKAGDTVWIAGGTYSESVRLRATGEADLPISFRSMPGERVHFDGMDRTIDVAFFVMHKHHLRFDGIYFTGFRKADAPRSGVFSLIGSDDIHITRCFMNGVGPGYANSFIYFTGDGLLLQNSVIASGFSGMYLHGNNVRIEHSVFLRNMIQAAVITGSGAQINHNIFVDSLPGKVRVQYFETPMARMDSYEYRDNAFYLRVPDEERQPFLFYGGGHSLALGSPARFSVAAYEKRTGHTGNVVLDPKFQITTSAAPTDRDGKPLEYLGDWVVSQKNLDFPDLYPTHPDLVKRNIGLNPEAFADFHFNQK